MIVLEANELTYATPMGRVLQDQLSFQLCSGQMLLITGPNGCGKSTLLKTLLGQFPLIHGNVKCTVSSDKTGYIPQLENTEIHLPMTLRDVMTVSQTRRLSDNDLTRYGLIDKAHLSAAWNTASGGERKRALLTRALLRNPSMLVFDEPMNHLDGLSRRAMVAAMSDFLASGKRDARTILMVSHQGLHEDEAPLFDIVSLSLNGAREVA